jgi:hypothetical protein
MARVRLPVVASQRARLDAERLFRDLFLPLYPPGADLGAIRRTDANPAANPAILRALDETAELFARLAPEALEAPGLALDFSDASVHRLGAVLTRAARDRLLERRAGPGEPPLLAQVVIHGAVYVGACVRRTRPEASRWLVRSPLWETRVELSSVAGVAELAPLAWWLRSLSDDDVEKVTLGDRYRTHVEEPTLDAAAWPVFVPTERRLPRLSRPTYDTLVKYLHAHLPEVGDLGEHFPSPERFVELGFRWIEMLAVGGGRAVLMHGPADRGVHLFWVTKAGFTKAVYVEADAAPEHRVRVEVGAAVERVVLEVSRGGALVRDEMLWWGP